MVIFLKIMYINIKMENRFNISDFNETLSIDEYQPIMREYREIIGGYLIHISESITIHNKDYYEYIVSRGLDTLKHCFNLLLLYTKNISIVSCYCKKALCYYVEFIGQIAQDSNSYLELNAKDATLFVYKKTIFEIDPEYRKNYVSNVEECPLFELISLNAEIYNNLIINNLHIRFNLDYMGEIDMINIVKQCSLSFAKLYNKNISIEANIIQNKSIEAFINIMHNQVSAIEKYVELCNIFIKKCKKRNITIATIRGRFYMEEYIPNLQNFSSLKFVNWVFQAST
tara:strand:- start:12518 stop:13372 length:855 start_codon:yes stop_codon:yes gene_type:complete